MDKHVWSYHNDGHRLRDRNSALFLGWKICGRIDIGPPSPLPFERLLSSFTWNDHSRLIHVWIGFPKRLLRGHNAWMASLGHACRGQWITPRRLLRRRVGTLAKPSMYFCICCYLLVGRRIVRVNSLEPQEICVSVDLLLLSIRQYRTAVRLVCRAGPIRLTHTFDIQDTSFETEGCHIFFW